MLQVRPMGASIKIVCCLILMGFSSAWAGIDGEVAILTQEIRALLSAQRDASTGAHNDPAVLLKLSSLYLDLGDSHADTNARSAAYEEGARFAKQVLQQTNDDPDAHYLYAANLGSRMELKGLVASAKGLREVKAHVRRALELRPDHAPSQHMMGMMLERLPSLLGGDGKAALQHLQRAVALDPGYAHARLDLAKAYLKRKDRSAARRELVAILEDRQGTRARRYADEAQTLLATLREER